MAGRKSLSLLGAIGELSFRSSRGLSSTGSWCVVRQDGGIATATRLPLATSCRNYGVNRYFKSPNGKTNRRQREKENNYIYPPQMPNEPRRPGEICRYTDKIKYSQKKLWYIAAMIRGLSIDEAVKQLTFSPHKGAYVIKKILLDLQQEAVDNHVCEYKSNLWVEASQAENWDMNIRIMNRYKGKHQIPRGRLQFASYFVRLREGKPPKHYYPPPLTGYEKMEEYIKRQRSRTVKQTL